MACAFHDHYTDGELGGACQAILGLDQTKFPPTMNLTVKPIPN